MVCILAKDKPSDTKMSHRRGSETKVAPGLALPPTTIKYGRRGPIPRRGLYALSPTQEQERAENQRRILKSYNMVVLNTTLDNERLNISIVSSLANSLN